MNERIKQVRISNDKTQLEFANSLGLTRNYIAMIEIGQREPSDRTIADICRIFNINETWLRTGEGEMQAKVSRQEEISRFVREAMNGASDSDTQRILIALMEATPDEIAAIANFARRIAGQVPGLIYATEKASENNATQEHFLPAHFEQSHNLPLSEPTMIPGTTGSIESGFPDPKR